MIGGVSPESTVVYYQLLNQAARRALGGDHSADIVIHSLDFGVMHQLYDAADWDGFTAKVASAARGLEAADCELIAISSNTTQVAAEASAAAVDAPFVFLIDALADAIRAKGAARPLLLGTRFVMEGHFYRPTLQERFGIDCVTPSEPDRAEVDRIIFEELSLGAIRDASRARFLEIIERGRDAGADSAILGCTEFNLFDCPSRTETPLFDTTLIHAAAIARAAYGEPA